MKGRIFSYLFLLVKIYSKIQAKTKIKITFMGISAYFINNSSFQIILESKEKYYFLNAINSVSIT